MRKISKKRALKAASVSDSSSDDESLPKNKRSRNGAGKKDGASESDSDEAEKNDEKDGKDYDKKPKPRQNEKKSIDDKKKKQDVDESDESDGSKSEDETVSEVPANKKSDSSSSKGKGKEKEHDDEQEKPGEEQVGKEEEYEVEEIVSHKRSHGNLLYLIRWKGYGPDGDTWEDVSTLDNCPDILKKYTDEHLDSSAKLPKRSKSDKKEKNHKKSKQIVGEEIDANADYEVEKILDVFFKKDKTREFLIRWKGYGAASDSWEPEEQLNCPDMIDKFMAKVDRAKNLPEKELRQNRTHTQRFTLMGQSNDRRLSKRHGGKQRAVYYDAEL